MRSVLGVHWKDWCWSWNSNTLAKWVSEELTHLKRPWCWERLRAGGEADDREWDSWMVSLTQWTWVWVNSGSWWWTGRLGMLRFMGLQGAGHGWATELNWLRDISQHKVQKDKMLEADLNLIEKNMIICKHRKVYSTGSVFLYKEKAKHCSNYSW